MSGSGTPLPLSSTGTPLQLSSANLSEVTAAIEHRALTGPVSVDGGNLRLEPTTEAPKIGETQVLARWSHLETARNDGATELAVAHTRATITVPVETPATNGAKTYDRVPSWAVITYTAERANCVYEGWDQGTTATPAPPGPRVLDITLVADDGTNRIVSYKTAGSRPCSSSADVPARATIAATRTSVPWTYVSTGVPSTRFRNFLLDEVSFTLPNCARDVRSGQTLKSNVIYTYVAEVGLGATCPPTSAGSMFFGRTKTTPLRPHAPTGPVGKPHPWPAVFDGTTTAPSSPPA